jgi:RNA polymerase sigma factor (sigma-70 family)
LATAHTPELTDEELTRAVHERGDAQAFAMLYERHSASIYDFICRMLRDADAAADVTQDTFANAWKNLQKRQVTGNVRAWLFTIARNRAINEIRSSRHYLTRHEREGEDDPLVYAQVDSNRLNNPEQSALDEEMAELVWTSAAALQPREYSLLDMHLRQGLSPEEIADATGVSKRNVYVNLFRLRKSLEKSVAGVLMLRRGRRQCEELDAILVKAGAADEMTPRLSRLVSRHVERCARCQDLRRHFVSPVEIFAGLALIPLPEESRIAIWNGIVMLVAAGATAGAFVAGTGAGIIATVVTQPARWVGDKMSGLSGAAVAAAAAGGLIAGIGILLVATQGGSDAPRDPDDVHSPTHRVGQESSSNVIKIAWSRQADVAGYSVDWSSGSSRLPDQVADLPGDATSARSEPLAPGRWFFNLRTSNEDRRWTSTVHVGPFIIGPFAVREPGETSPTPTPSPVVAAVSATPVEVESSSSSDSAQQQAGTVMTPGPRPFGLPAGAPQPTVTPPPGTPPSGTTPGPTTPTPTLTPGPGPSTPTPTPVLTPTPTEIPIPTPTETPTPTPGPGSSTPTPDPGSSTPTPDPSTPTPTPDQGSPTPTPHPGTSTPTPGPGSPTPTPEPSPGPFTIEIDIVPGSTKNKVHLVHDDYVKVALFLPPPLDGADINSSSLRFLGAAPSHSKLEDLNGDGRLDLLAKFKVAEMSLAHGKYQACLTGQVLDGRSFQGCDEIHVVGPPDSGDNAALSYLGPAGLALGLALVVAGGTRRR